MKEGERAGDTSGVFFIVLVEGYGPGRGRRTLQMNNRSLLRARKNVLGRCFDGMMPSTGNRIGRQM